MVMAFMLCVAAVALAQNGDKLFIDGQKLQQTMTVAFQNAAIQKFKAAKVAYTTADKKKMCDNQIAICNKNISQIKRGGGGGSGKKGASQTASTATTSTRFSVSHSNGHQVLCQLELSIRRTAKQFLDQFHITRFLYIIPNSTFVAPLVSGDDS